MSKSVAAPQSSVTPSLELAPQQDQAFPWMDVFQGSLASPMMTLAAYGSSRALGNDFLKEMCLAPKRAEAALAAKKQSPEERYALAKTPEEKLIAWRELHMAKANAALGEHEKTSWWNPFDADPAQHRNAVKDATLASTSAEVDDEISALQAKHAADGTPLTMGEVEALAARKTMELNVEATHGVNLSNAAGATDEERAKDPAAAAKKDADRRVWSVDELTQANETFSRTPIGNLSDNDKITEFHRAARDEVSGTRQGDYEGGVINVYDRANDVRLDPETGRTVDGASGGLAQTLARQVAMGVAAQNPEVYAKYAGVVTDGNGQVEKKLLPSTTDPNGEESWKDAQYNAGAAWQQQYSKSVFDQDQTRSELVDAPAAQLNRDEIQNQREMQYKLWKTQTGADVTERAMLEKEGQVRSDVLSEQRQDQERRDSMWELMKSVW